ncbi:flagellar hook assembly protein FlgD [Halobacillus sp. KGW1]|uniref:flagellar hook assembly protein FlgD n=1 Tax=Halobacillus sp. KGW1 TaxID=1793726 RepID=UPI000785EABA|nr:flagellar hook assembly protein FlgD [Halobacillus sp. KGW1]
MTAIDPSIYLKNQQKQTSGSNILGKDDFLKILMTQIQNQNPLDPMEDKEFIAQMTQFSSLEQMTNMSQSLQSFLDGQQSPPLIQYSHLIGKEVSYAVTNPETGSEEVKAGQVVSVKQKDGDILLEIEDGAAVPVGSLTQIKDVKVEE